MTGGVVSALGKGIASASLAAVLEARKLNVTLLKLDPYINVDPGTMNPAQHGEVYVTEDGAETDLDLGHYERFVRTTMTKKNNYTSGYIYSNVIQRERSGDYLGETVQVIPHFTDEIKRCIFAGAGDVQIAMVEIGGTVGDIESLPFLEAIRQIRIELGAKNTLFMHLTLVPYIAASGETKTKPTQHSVKELRSIGIQPDILLCRMAERVLSDSERKKIALFTNVEESAIFSAVDVDNLYKIPEDFCHQGIDEIVVQKLALKAPIANLVEWDIVVRSMDSPAHQVDIAMVGKYVNFSDAYKSLNEALTHAGIHTNTTVRVHYIDSEDLSQKEVAHRLQAMDAILVPGGFGVRGIAGKILAIQYARENNIPYLGICLGMQLAVIEYARHQTALHKANSTEFESDTQCPVIALVSEWEQNGVIEQRKETDDLGGTMRLGGQECRLIVGSKIEKIYSKGIISERHRHRYELNNKYKKELEDAGMVFTGLSMDEKLVEVVELSDHPWFIACQFHPEFTSTPRDGHPLFSSFINAAREHKEIAAQACIDRGLAEYEAGRHEEAIAEYDKALKINPKFAEAYYNRGLIKHELGDSKGAIADFDQAIKIDPQYVEAYTQRGLAKDKLGDKAGAKEDYKYVMNYQETVNETM